MVGGGIFAVLGLTVQVAGAGAYLSFLVGGTVAALTGVSYARLSVVVHSRGGTAAFLDRAFGRRIAGPLNLLLWLSYFVMLGLYAVAFGAYLAALLGLDPNGKSARSRTWWSPISSSWARSITTPRASEVEKRTRGPVLSPSLAAVRSHCCMSANTSESTGERGVSLDVEWTRGLIVRLAG